MLLLVILVGSIFFISGYRVARLFPALTSLAPAVGMAVLFVGFGVLGRTSNRIQPAIDVLLYGPDRHYDQTLIHLRDELLADPQAETLKKVLLERVPEVLEVREAALLLADSDGKLLPSASTPGALAIALPAADFNGSSAVLLHQTEPAGLVFRVVPWARMAVLLRLRGQTVGLLMLGGKIQSDYFDARDVRFLQRLAAWAGVAIENVRLFEALQDMAAERLRVRAAERTQLANRLHDEPLQRAYAIARDLEQLSSAQPAHSALAGELDRQREEVRELSRELRGITSGLRPPILNQGLMFALDDVIRRFTERFPGVGVERAVASEEPPPLSDEALDAAYFVVTEALTNVGKHAQASRVLVRVESLADAVRIIVSDNGESAFLASLSWVELARDQHHGVLGMHQWAKAAKGGLRMYAVQPRGTEIELTLPLNGIANSG